MNKPIDSEEVIFFKHLRGSSELVACFPTHSNVRFFVITNTRRNYVTQTKQFRLSQLFRNFFVLTTSVY